MKVGETPGNGEESPSFGEEPKSVGCCLPGEGYGTELRTLEEPYKTVKVFRNQRGSLMSVENPKNIRAALIGAGATIIAALIAVFPQFSDLKNDLKNAKEQVDSLEEECHRLELQLAQAEREQGSVTGEPDFQNGAEQFDEQMAEEITSLEADISELKYTLSIEESKRAESELNYQNIQASYYDLSTEYERLLAENALLKEQPVAGNITESGDSADISYESAGSKISVFTMDVFQNRSFWFTAGSSSADLAKITDTYGNEYPKAHFTIHGTKEKGRATNPIYLLNDKYSKCEGQIAWSKRSMNEKGSVWIDFYSGDELIFSTDVITAVDEAISFEFDVSGVKTLEIVCNGSTDRGSVHYLSIFESCCWGVKDRLTMIRQNGCF